MNTYLQAYVDGASMAYRDVAGLVRDMLSKIPEDLSEGKPLLVFSLTSIANACEAKAIGTQKEADRIIGIHNGDKTDA